MVKENLRFGIWTKKSGYDVPMGEYIIKNDTIYEVIPHSKNGRDLDYETTELVTNGFAYEYADSILKILFDGEDEYIGKNYIKIFTPRPLATC